MKQIMAVILLCDLVLLFWGSPLWADQTTTVQQPSPTVQQPSQPVVQQPSQGLTQQASKTVQSQPSKVPPVSGAAPNAVQRGPVSNPILMLLERNPRVKEQIRAIQASGNRMTSPITLPVGEVFKVYPNPSASNVLITFSTEKLGPVSFTVSDAQGKTVREMAYPVQPPGLHRVVWDGKAADGKLVTTGGYSLKMASGDGVKISQFSYIR